MEFAEVQGDGVSEMIPPSSGQDSKAKSKKRLTVVGLFFRHECGNAQTATKGFLHAPMSLCAFVAKKINLLLRLIPASGIL